MQRDRDSASDGRESYQIGTDNGKISRSLLTLVGLKTARSYTTHRYSTSERRQSYQTGTDTPRSSTSG